MAYKQTKDQETGEVIWIDEESGLPVRDPQIHDAQADEHSHLQEGKLFHNEESRFGKRLVIGENEDPFEVAASRQQSRRVEKMSEAVSKALSGPQEQIMGMMNQRVADPVDSRVMKVSFEQFQQMQEDPDFESFSKYAAKLLYYVDASGHPDMNKPRPHSVRPLLQNEVGLWHKKDGTYKIVTLLDRGPGDVGEGKYHQVHPDTPTEEKKHVDE